MPPKSSAIDRLRAWLEYPVSNGPTVSADGQWLYFISNRNGVPQAWGVPIAGGEAVCLYAARENVDRVAASREGSSLILSVDRGGDEHWQLLARDGNDQTRPILDLTREPNRIHEPGAWRDGRRYAFSSNARDQRFFDVYEIDAVGGGQPLLLRQEDAWVSVWAARENRVLLSRANTNLDRDLILLDGGREILLTPHSGELAVWAADLVGGDVVACANPDREFAALMRYRPGKSPEVIRGFDAEVELVKGEPSRSRVAFAVNRKGWSELHVLDLETNAERVLDTPGAGVVTSLAWIPDGDGFAFDFDSPTTGGEIWRSHLASGAFQPLTKSPVSMPGAPVEPSLHAFHAEDGLEIPYWEYVPTHGPIQGTIIDVHGGPESQSRPRFGGGVNAFLVGEGWRVIDPNVRGSTGYGRTYVHLDDVRKRMDSVRDLRDLVGALALEGKARPGRIGISGGSYGGFMVLSAITTYPELWGAAVEFFGISNFVTFLEHTGVWRRKVREDEYGSLERDREFLEAISPIHQVDRIATPLLVAHGQNDPRVPIVEAEQIVEALRTRGVPVEFLRYGNEGHGFNRRENQLDSLGRAAEFFARYLSPTRPDQGEPHAPDRG
ncbi:MAG: prolyl oligopeptidase family serine peptidase [Thermoplasmata archaeon]